jgi:hypothetical protein
MDRLLDTAVEEMLAISLTPTPRVVKPRFRSASADDDSDDPLQSTSPVYFKKMSKKKSQPCTSPLSFNGDTDPLLYSDPF